MSAITLPSLLFFKTVYVILINFSLAEVDYSQSSQPFTTTFDSESTGSMICVDFNIMDDDLVEGPEVFRLILNTDDDFPVVDPGIANVTINDNDGK